MATETPPTLSLLLLLLMIFSILLFSTIATPSSIIEFESEEEKKEEEDAEVRLCKEQCKHQQQFGETERALCADRCDEYGRVKKDIERSRRRRRCRPAQEPAERKLVHCRHECRAGQQMSARRRAACERRCEEEYDEEEEEGRIRVINNEEGKGQGRGN